MKVRGHGTGHRNSRVWNYTFETKYKIERDGEIKWVCYKDLKDTDKILEEQ